MISSIAKQMLRPVWRALFRKSPGESLSRYVEGVVVRSYKKKHKRLPAWRSWLERVGDPYISNHWAHYVVPNEVGLWHLKSQLYELISVLKERVGHVSDTESVLDVGASDGLFLKALEIRNGLGMNILRECAVSVRRDGFRACQADLEEMPFRSGQFDYVVCCETLEHLPNPIRGLKELGRVCRKKIFVSIPWLPSTRITPRSAQHNPDVHVFEFCEADFEKIVSHSGLKIVHRELVQVFPEGIRAPHHAFLLRRFFYPNYFPRLQFYVLEPAQ